MRKFRQKDFSILADIAKGATIGGTIGGFGAKVLGQSNNAGLVALGAGTLVGASLGALYGFMKEGSIATNRRTTVNDRLMNTVIDNLKKSGLKEDKDFTRDPKIANLMKTKVCIVVTRSNGDLKLLVNTVADFKLKEVTEGMIKHIPNSSVVNKKMSDKFNEVSITSISDNSADSGLITGIAEYFIHHHYPVYLVEVG